MGADAKNGGIEGSKSQKGEVREGVAGENAELYVRFFLINGK